MKSIDISLQRLTYFAMLLFLATYLLVIGQPILAPLVFGALFAFMRKPVSAFFERKVKWQVLAILLAMSSAVVPIIFASFFLSIIYVFLFLLYRSAFNNFVLLQVGPHSRERVGKLIKKIQALIQRYIYGMLMVILILGVLNSTGLWIIGIRYPMFWGFLAATLAIVPYIGTFVGGLLPFLYALATTGGIWPPVAVVVLFLVVQALEGNLITPNVVGSAVNVNPLAAIIALLVGAKIWGIAGMVLALPSIAVLKEILKQSDAWRPVGYLLSEDIAGEENIFEKKWDKERFRLRHFFKNKNEK